MYPSSPEPTSQQSQTLVAGLQQPLMLLSKPSSSWSASAAPQHSAQVCRLKPLTQMLGAPGLLLES
jgi:hypothetical protein